MMGDALFCCLCLSTGHRMHSLAVTAGKYECSVLLFWVRGTVAAFILGTGAAFSTVWWWWGRCSNDSCWPHDWWSLDGEICYTAVHHGVGILLLWRSFLSASILESRGVANFAEVQNNATTRIMLCSYLQHLRSKMPPLCSSADEVSLADLMSSGNDQRSYSPSRSTVMLIWQPDLGDNRWAGQEQWSVLATYGQSVNS